MGWLDLAAGAVALAAVVALIVRRFRRRAVDASSGDSVPSTGSGPRRRADTALSELRDMREALGPATHNRVERRRNPPPGTAPKIERRKKGVRRAP